MELILTGSRITFSTIKARLVKVVKAMIEARQAEADRQIAAMHLYRMTDKELRDIGITRGDIERAVKGKY